MGADAPDFADLDRRALAHRDAVLARIIIRGGGYHADRVSSQLQALNRDAPRLADLCVKVDETGRFSASPDSGSVSGRGFTSLVATLADISTDRAAAWIARLPELVEPRT